MINEMIIHHEVLSELLMLLQFNNKCFNIASTVKRNN
jgi:hypothetical protein